MLLHEGLTGNGQSVRIGARLAPIAGQTVAQLRPPFEETHVADVLGDVVEPGTITDLKRRSDRPPILIGISGQGNRRRLSEPCRCCAKHAVAGGRLAERNALVPLDQCRIKPTRSRRHYSTDYAVVCSSGGFTDAAIELATSNKVLLCNANQLVARLDAV